MISTACYRIHLNMHMFGKPWSAQHKPELCWPVLRTTKMLTERCHLSREVQDKYGLWSQQALL